jgi:hypothetical protein
MLQIGFPVFSSITLMTSNICSSRRYCSTTGHMVSFDPSFLEAISLTSVREPFALVNKLRFGSQGHKVTLHNEVRVLLAEEERRSAGSSRRGVIRGTLAFERHGGRQCWGMWHRRHIRGLLRSRRCRVWSCGRRRPSFAGLLLIAAFVRATSKALASSSKKSEKRNLRLLVEI